MSRLLGAVRRRRAAERGERGAILLVFVLCITLILVVVAFTIDLGQARFSKRDEQSAADLAALDAGYFLSGRGAGSVPISQPAAACAAAVQSVQRNVAGFAPVIPAATITSKCAALPATSAACVAGTPVTVTFSAGDYVLAIRYPLPTAELDTTGFAGGVGVQDGTDACQRMKVGLAKTDDTAFAGVIGIDELPTAASAVVRSATSSSASQTAALLLLERVGCGSLQTSGGGSSGSGVYVQKSSATNPGIIAADSAGQVGPCTTNNNAGGWVIYGTSLPAAGGGGPSITAEPASAAIPGIISIYAKAVGGRAGYTAPTGLSVEPTAGSIASRTVADTKYNGANTQITQLHAAAYATTTLTDAQAVTAGYTVVSGTNPCKGNVPAAALAATKVFVSCATFEPEANLFPNATDFVVRGNINLKSNKTLSLPMVQNLTVRGCGVSGCSGGNVYAIQLANNASLLVNTGDTTIPNPTTGGTTCASRKGPGNGGTVTNKVRLATFGGSLSVSGFARLCQTTVYLGENGISTYAKRTVTGVGTAPESYPAIAACTVALPCPKDSAAPFSFVDFGGGSGSADWSAPNQLSADPQTADLAYSASPTANPFEDLALWAESSSASNIKGQGVNTTQGVFFLPNASFLFQGQGTQSQPLNAQFISRSLNVSGQGSLVMRPNPNDSLKVATAGAIALIR